MTPPMNTTFPVCIECGYAHPPLKPGEKCPMAKEKSPSGNVIDFEEIFMTLKNIMTSQIQQKDIKDIKKFFGNIIIKITKISEEYKE